MNDKKTKPTILEALISQYESQYYPSKGKALPDLTVEDFLWHVSRDTFKAQTDFVRKGKTKEERKRLKDNGPKGTGCYCVTVAGTFATKTNEGVKSYSGIIGIDLDDLYDEVDEVRRQMINDPYTFAVFRSISGTGLCVLVKIQPERFADAFLALEQYYLETYGRKIDKACKNVSRLRYGSHDPGIFCYRDTDEEKTPIPYNPKALLWKSYLKKSDQKKQTTGTFIHTKDDLDFVVKQVIDQRVDITPEYSQRLRVCFALISELGESARQVFHEICKNQQSSPYDFHKVDKMFTYALGYGSREITIATFYYLAKQAGLQIMTEKTKEIVSVASMYKKQHGTQEGAVSHLKKMCDIPVEQSRDIVKQVFDSREEIRSDETLFDQLELFLRSNYSLSRNAVTRYLENDGKQILDEHLNDIYIRAAKTFNMKVTKSNVLDLLQSNFVVTHHPIKLFFAAHEHRKPVGLIDRLAETLHHNMDTTKWNNYAHLFIRKWLIGMVSSVFGEQCPLVLVLTGPPNTGKTQWFRRLLPLELRSYYAETKFEKGSDDEMLMCKKLLLMNDEFGGKTVLESKKFKDLTDKQIFTLRKPYGKTHEDLARLAVLAGTSNDVHILNDPTGNRRIIPINVLGIDHESYNSIDKIDLLMEAYHAYQGGERCSLTFEEIAFLNRFTDRFEEVVAERELVEKYYSVPQHEGDINAFFLGTTEIKVDIETRTQQKLGLKRLAQELKRMTGKDAVVEWTNGKAKRGYWLIKH